MLLLLISCTKPSDSGTHDSYTYVPPDEVELDGECEMAVDFGGFTIRAASGSTDVDGSVADGVVPISVLEETVTDGDCRLLKRNNPYCDPGCDAGETCDFDGTCLPYPPSQDLGTVSIYGLAQAVEMEPVFPGNTYFDTSLPHPAWSPGDVLVLEMPGGVYGPAELHGVGVDELTGINEPWAVEGGEDFTVTWDAPTTDEVHSQIEFFLNIDLHGISPSVMRCSFEDTGSATVSGAVIEALVDTGVTGFPSASLERRTVDKADAGEGCMDFQVSSKQSVDIDVVGFTPCVTNAECPEGQECNEEFQICE
ncbi:MAG TPA: hypothetical protein QGF58_30360 [Myxococcota bacterium]|nr:hypothetical protein [Myxococcota bacterium]